MILESDPRPRYYKSSDIPVREDHVKDHHFYLIIKNPLNCFQDVVLRHAIKIKEKHNLSLHIFPGQMSFQNKMHPCIRINTFDPEQLAPVIAELQRINIRFVNDKQASPYESFIQYKRFIEFEQLFPGVYQDTSNPYRYFFRIPVDIDFEDFQNIIERIKNNCDFHLFDSFLTYLFYQDEILDFAGVYSHHCNKEKFLEFKSEIEKEVKKIR